MTADYDVPTPPAVTDREERILCEVMQQFAELQTYRNTFAAHWEEVAELILPTSRNTFYYGNYNWPGQKKTDRQVDSSGALALTRFSAICDSLLTPRNMKWHQLGASNPALMKDRQVRLWFERATDILFKVRYAQQGNFAAQNQNNYQGLGAFGTAGMFADRFDGPERGIRYRSVPLGELFIMENHQGLVDGFIRWFRLTARQAKQKWPDTFPATLQPAVEKNSEWPYNFLHRVVPNKEYDPEKLDIRGKRFHSCYISIEGKALLGEGGYDTFPMAISRYDQTPGEMYGRSPAMMVLPTLKTLNAQKRVFLKSGHRAADPVLLLADDGIMDFSLRPGAVNKGGVNSDGRPLVHVLPSGNIQITKEMMDEERSIVNDAFLVTLFQILEETPQMTATEVVERVNEKGILLAPTIGRQQSEYLGPLIDRELSLLAEQGMLPPMPPLLREAHGEYEVVYTSPLSRAMRAQEISGFQRSLEVVTNIVNVTQDPSHYDVFDFDTAIPAIADAQAVPESWMADPRQMAQKRAARAKQAQTQQQIQAAPAVAALMKAQAATGAQGGQEPGQQVTAPPGPVAQPGGQQ